MTDPRNKATFEECRQLILKSSSIIEEIKSKIKNVILSENPSKPFELNMYLESLIQHLKLIEQSKVFIKNNNLDNSKLLDDVREIPKYVINN